MAEIKSIETKIIGLIEETIVNLGYELYDVEYLKIGKEYHLCVYVEKDGTMDINDCEKVNNAIEPILDKEDPIKDMYFLEVSSAGLERKLRTKKHYEKQIGKKVEISLFVKIDNQKVFEGVLKSVDDDGIVIDNQGNDLKFEFEKIASGKSVFDWNEEL